MIQSLEQMPEFERHQRKCRIQFGLRGFCRALAQLVENDVQKPQFAHDQILAEHETDAIVEHQPQLEHLLA